MVKVGLRVERLLLVVGEVLGAGAGRIRPVARRLGEQTRLRLAGGGERRAKPDHIGTHVGGERLRRLLPGTAGELFVPPMSVALPWCVASNGPSTFETPQLTPWESDSSRW
jgi:hypothetical protein